MTDLHTIRREEAAIRRWHTAVSETAAVFERRWTLAMLKRVAPEIHRRLVEQRGLFDKAMITGAAAEVDLHGAALARGWAKAIQACEQAGAPDDAYMLGCDPRTGFQLAIGQQKPAAARVREVYGGDIVWLTPDEIAAIVASLEAFKPVAAIKRLWPGAEMLEVRPSGAAMNNREGA